MLFKKMVRNIKRSIGVYISCICIIIIAVLIYTMFAGLIDNLTKSKNSFYEENNFADGFIKVINMPDDELEDIRRIKGIKRAEGRLLEDVRTTNDKTLRVMNLTENLNGVTKDKAKDLESGSLGIWIDKKFADTNNLDLNDEIEVIANGKKRDLKIFGIVYSPEFIYATKDITELYPNPEKFGIAFTDKKSVETLFAKKGIINEVVFEMEKDADFDNIKNKLKEDLKKYGIEYIVAKKDQQSNFILNQEIKGLESMAKSMPLMFLMISGFILIIVLKKLVENERSQIGMLKSFGYTKFQILFHYISYGMFVGIVGGLIGGILGYILTGSMLEMYKIYFTFPEMLNEFHIGYFLEGVFLAVSLSSLSALLAARKILKLTPAESMRPKPPKFSQKYFIENIKLFWNNLSTQGKMAIRNVFRNKGRSFFTFVGLSFSFAILASPFSMNEAVDVMITDQFEKAQTYDFKVSFKRPVSKKQIENEFENFKYKEGLLEIPVKLKKLNKEEDVAVIGIEENSKLYNILDKNRKKVKIGNKGMVLSKRLAEKLNVKEGEYLTVESYYMENELDDKKILVTKIIPQYLGMNAYMNLENLNYNLNQKDIITSVIMDIDKRYIKAIKDKYEESDIVGSMETTDEIKEKFDEMMGSMTAMIGIMIVFGIGIAFSVIYSSSIVSLSQRKRELASIRLIGMTVNEVLEIISVEQWFIAFFSFIASVPLLYSMQQGMAQSMENDLYSMPPMVTRFSIVMSIVFGSISILIAQIVIRKKIKNFKLVEVLKERE